MTHMHECEKHVPRSCSAELVYDKSEAMAVKGTQLVMLLVKLRRCHMSGSVT